ncbi:MULTISPECIES: hydroxyisourate hydrolase [Methylobacterium]|jgi:5-hydroxyisourate hydrolase|uniref:hydroxyisourate hydrolase n=1 Tax=Methylobacterium TaxID=407 RepID=UPI0011C1EFA0|nr:MULTISPECIES: hydroxyisourate hydrolase [Methylobacterium]QEE41061.1 hydroxyisourate hydrolase [Methylobacterium sp. WL1]TXM98999.1 hydroxyisourate hydrolase [Methylobacterium sp. WL64]TXN46133.1 hydroxyisourate hydrolase [Methylobacterium sp. WL7]TXN50370.1 hydroxyisourate hydrolase [Methylobacterium sp. WL18]TXN58911.1 hydroxyisourate hydrolase [Methylobacterium sp. WL2]
MAGISTHVLDTDRGRPAAGVRIDFSVLEDGTWRLVKSVVTNADGRTDAPILPAGEARTGQYELAFHVADYFRDRPGTDPGDVFIDDPVVRFAIFDAGQHYHVPMLCAPASFTTYRGS